MAQNLAQKKSTFRRVGNTNVPHKPPSKSRNWCFTLNNPTYIEDDTIQCEKFERTCKIFCYQLEIGENGTEHFQGTIGYTNAICFNTMKRLLPRAHWEPCHNLKRALAYCSKFNTRKKDTIPRTFNYEVFNDGKPLTQGDVHDYVAQQMIAFLRAENIQIAGL